MDRSKPRGRLVSGRCCAMGRQWLWFALPAAATTGLFVLVAIFAGGIDDEEPAPRPVAATTAQEQAVEPPAATRPRRRAKAPATTRPRRRTQTTATESAPTATATQTRAGAPTRPSTTRATSTAVGKARTTTTRGTQTSPQGRAVTALVPDFRGLTEELAVGRVEAAGFEASVRHVRSFQPDGTVVEQKPRAGARASRGRVVTLVVSVLKARRPPPQRRRGARPLSILPHAVGLADPEGG
jgi:hypothetical protein